MKGIRGGIMQDIHFHQGYRQYALTLSADQLKKIDYTAGKNPASLLSIKLNSH